ncbi:MAG TPA: Uma2 family endonuclease [Thermoanaerobaculia bacterium]|nr:Uma2 family endonuclease [Thermoanaerobaculia bacterium]
MAARVREHATYEDLIRLPENMVGELIDGELYASPRPAGPHTLAASVLGGLFLPPFQLGVNGPGGWWILDEPELHLGRNVLVPDLAGWRKERMPEIPKNHIFSISPDWVCEVTSPSNGRIDRLKKMPLYARADVQYMWIVEPEQQTIEAFRLEGAGWFLLGTFGEEPTARIEPLADIEIDLTLLWGPLPS